MRSRSSITHALPRPAGELAHADTPDPATGPTAVPAAEPVAGPRTARKPSADPAPSHPIPSAPPKETTP